MPLTDRQIFKERQSGVANTYGLAGNPTTGVVAEIHQMVFTWDVGSDATIAEIGQRIDKKCIVRNAYFTPTTALAAHATAYISLLVQKRDGAGGAAVTVASTDTATGGANVSLAAFVPAVLTLTTTAADLAVAAGNVLTFKSTESSTPTTPIGKVTVVVEWV